MSKQNIFKLNLRPLPLRDNWPTGGKYRDPGPPYLYTPGETPYRPPLGGVAGGVTRGASGAREARGTSEHIKVWGERWGELCLTSGGVQLLLCNDLITRFLPSCLLAGLLPLTFRAESQESGNCLPWYECILIRYPQIFDGLSGLQKFYLTLSVHTCNVP